MHDKASQGEARFFTAGSTRAEANTGKGGLSLFIAFGAEKE